MANVSSSSGLEKRPKLRFPGFDEPWSIYKAEELFKNITDKNHPTDEYSARDCAPQPLKLSIHSGGIEHPCRCR